MILGALVDLGITPEDLENRIKEVGVGEFSLKVYPVQRSCIGGTKVDVAVNESFSPRHYPDIIQIIQSSLLPPDLKNKAEAIFTRLAEAESKVHRIPRDKVHFHEIGAVDALVDIIGAVIGFELLGVEKVYSSPISLGTGTINVQHGPLPIPAPATLELIKNYPARTTKIPFELTTPTGAAILTTLSSGTDLIDIVSFSKIGYGAGQRDLKELPNFLRIYYGATQAKYIHDAVIQVETTIDDMNPEIVPYVMEKILQEGALDVYCTQVLVKKGRPGVQLTILISEGNLSAITDILFRETTTIGLRIQTLQRYKLEREEVIITTPFGDTKAKRVIFDGMSKIIPEYEECKRLAREQNLPISEIYNIIIKSQ